MIMFVFVESPVLIQFEQSRSYRMVNEQIIVELLT